MHTSPTDRPVVVDLFCGAGGLSLGSHAAGFRTSYAFDIDQDLTSSFKRNFPGTSLCNIDLGAIAPDEVAKAVRGRKRVDGVVGGPPCQGFSDIGRRKTADPRNALIGRFMEIVKVVRPKFFLMENVPGLKRSRYRHLLDAALGWIPSHYSVLELLSLNAADYGAATERTRLVVVGYDPSCVDTILESDIEGAQTAIKATVRDAIQDLPSPTMSSSHTPLEYKPEAPIGQYATRMRMPPGTGMSGSKERELNQQGLVTGVEGTAHTDAVIERFRSIAQGSRDPISRYPRLCWEKAAPVLRAGTGRDRGSFQAARPIHPEEPRVISVREAARIQGFPDWFQFSRTKWHSHRMIGNSVSPIFAEAILKVVRAKLN